MIFRDFSKNMFLLNVSTQTNTYKKKWLLMDFWNFKTTFKTIFKETCNNLKDLIPRINVPNINRNKTNTIIKLHIPMNNPKLKKNIFKILMSLENIKLSKLNSELNKLKFIWVFNHKTIHYFLLFY